MKKEARELIRTEVSFADNLLSLIEGGKDGLTGYVRVNEDEVLVGLNYKSEC